jgi:hypothetical protein
LLLTLALIALEWLGLKELQLMFAQVQPEQEMLMLIYRPALQDPQKCQIEEE